MTKGYLLSVLVILACASFSSIHAASFDRVYQVNLTTTTPYGVIGNNYQYFPNKSPYCDKGYAMTSDMNNWCHLRNNGSLAIVDSSSGTLSNITSVPQLVSQGSNVMIASSGMYIMIQAIQTLSINVVIFDTVTGTFPFQLTTRALFGDFVVNENGLLLSSYVGNNITFVPTGTSTLYNSGYLKTILPNVTISKLAWIGDNVYLAEITNEIFVFSIENNLTSINQTITASNFVQFNYSSTVIVYSSTEEGNVTVYTYNSNSSTLLVPTNQTILSNIQVVNVTYILNSNQTFINLKSGGVIYDFTSSQFLFQYGANPALTLQNGTEVNYTSIGFFIQNPEQAATFLPFQIDSSSYNKAQAQMFYAVSYNDVTCDFIAINSTSSEIILNTFANCPFNGALIKEVFNYNAENVTLILQNATEIYAVNSTNFVPLKLAPVNCDNDQLFFSVNYTQDAGYISCMYQQVFTVYQGNFSTGNFHPFYTYNGYNINSIQKISDQYYLLYQTNGAQGYFNLFDIYNLSSVGEVTVDTTFQVAYPMGIFEGNVSNYTGLVAVYRNNFTGYLVDTNGSLTQFGSAYDIYPVGPYQFFSIQQVDYGYLYTYFEVTSWTTIPVVTVSPDLGYIWIFVGAFAFLFVALIICYRQKILCCVGEVTPKRERNSDYQRIKNTNVNNA